MDSNSSRSWSARSLLLTLATRNIQLMGRNPQVGQYAIYFTYTIKTQKPFQEAKIVMNKNKAFIVRRVSQSILVLIEA